MITVCAAPQLRGQEARTRVGVHAGLQTNLQRYTVFPYTGEFQSLLRESVTIGLVLRHDFDEVWGVMLGGSMQRQDWSAIHDGDPRIEIVRQDRTFISIDVQLSLRPPLDFIPLYLALGPSILVSTDGVENRQYVVQYTAFTERNGRQTTARHYTEKALRIAATVDAGLDLPLTSCVSLVPSVRFLHPFGRLVDTEDFSLRDFSYWRMSLGILVDL
ncbi:MAG: hypothetical protein JXA28_01445 [Bacteroidetes bacterium]|nr:hypothetical protein [Bacteroidota bacterium]